MLLRKGDGKASLKWLRYTLINFALTGLIGIMQKVQQSSKYASESLPFLALAFIVAFFICYIFSRYTKNQANEENVPKLRKGIIAIAVLHGAFIAFLNVVNLYLSGKLPSALLFPIQNGGTTVLTVLLAIFIFKEPLTKRKSVGLLIGRVVLF